MLWTWSLNEPALSLTEGPHGQPIRLWGIDAPEGGQLCQRDGKPWQCGQVVRTHSTSSHPPNSNLQHPWCLSELNFTGSSPVLQSSEIGALSNLSSHLSTILAPRFIGIHTANGCSCSSRAASNSCRRHSRRCRWRSKHRRANNHNRGRDDNNCGRDRGRSACHCSACHRYNGDYRRRHNGDHRDNHHPVVTTSAATVVTTSAAAAVVTTSASATVVTTSAAVRAYHGLRRGHASATASPATSTGVRILYERRGDGHGKGKCQCC